MRSPEDRAVRRLRTAVVVLLILACAVVIVRAGGEPSDPQLGPDRGPSTAPGPRR